MTESAFYILAFYKFVSPKFSESAVNDLRAQVETLLREHSARGNVLVATEGINGTICYPSAEQDDIPLKEKLIERFPGLRTRLSFSHENVFHRLRVRIKQEIVTIGNSSVDPCVQVGQYVQPGPDWDKLLVDPECLVIDTRNDYEIALGTFENAVNPHTTSFNEITSWLANEIEQRRPKKIAMLCTGGIRCEKSTSYLLDLVEEKGISVYHLEGGILAYLDQVPAERSKFHGECYVFDKRVAVTHGLKPSAQYTACHACRHPLSGKDRQDTRYVPGISCGYCYNDETRRRQRYLDRQKQIQRSKETGHDHIYDPKEKKLKC